MNYLPQLNLRKANQVDKSLENFYQWVASKVMSSPNKNIHNNVIQLHRKPSLQNDVIKPSTSGFFKTQQSQPKAKDQQLQKQNDLNFNLTCNNCGENNHGSASCVQPPRRPKA